MENLHWVGTNFKPINNYPRFFPDFKNKYAIYNGGTNLPRLTLYLTIGAHRPRLTLPQNAQPPEIPKLNCVEKLELFWKGI